MFKNYFLITLRNLFKQKGLTVTNVLGLSIGMASALLFMLYAVNEFSFDRFHQHNGRLYQMVNWMQPFGGRTEEAVHNYMPYPVGPALTAEMSGVESTVRMRSGWDESYVRSNGIVQNAKISFADSNFFEVFSFPLLYGNKHVVLDQPHHLVLTEETAIRLFGEKNPTGKTLDIKLEDKFESYQVTGVAVNVPSNSTIKFDILLNFDRLYQTAQGIRSKNSWNSASVQTFVLLQPGSGLATNTAQMEEFYSRHYPDKEAKMRKENVWKGQGPPVSYKLQPFKEIHMGRDKWKGAAEVDPKSIWILLTIAASILIIACINFTTLAIGRSAGRAKEVGVRKVIGGSRRQLVSQFLTEALILSIVSGAIGIILALISLPYFNALADRQIRFSINLYPEIIWLTLAMILIAGLLAGTYPAMVISGFKPLEVLKSKLRLSGSNIFTKSLVTTQFVLSIGLAISTMLVVRQLNYMRNQDPGFNKENVLVVHADQANGKVIYPRFRQLGMDLSGVQNIASGEMSLGEGASWSQVGWNYQGEQKDAYEYFVDHDYVDVMGMELLAGKNFDAQMHGDYVIVNEKFVKSFGWTIQDAVGKPLEGYFDENKENKPLPIIVGVIKDFHFRPFKEEVKPQMFHHYTEDYTVPDQIFVRLHPGELTKTLKELENNWNAIEPVLPFRYSFLDEDLDRFYQSEARLSSIIGWAGGLSIFLACLGLFGLAALTAVNRTKEIGIRKVLGASIGSVINLLSKEFLILVGVSFSIAAPVAYYFVSQWLKGYAYRIEIPWLVFVLAGIAAMVVAFFTVGIQSFRAAMINPVKSLKSE
ncbi:MAG: ABC transporter permease [Saprospiraceae bacterium]|nr:ABC transporter permease [Saprospiraceae bacterium]